MAMLQTAHPFTVPPTQHPDEVLLTLQKWGIAVIPDYLAASRLYNLNQEFDRLLTLDTDWAKPSPYSVGQASRVKRRDIDRTLFPTTAEVFEVPFMEQLTALYMGDEADFNGDIFVVKDVVGSDHIANELHFDVLQTFKFFIYLTDTTAHNGAFRCIPGSHKVTNLIRKRLGSAISYENRHLTRELPMGEADAMPIEGDAGTLIIFDTDVFHQAGRVQAGERRVMRAHSR